MILIVEVNIFIKEEIKFFIESEENRISPYAAVKKPQPSSTNIRKKSKFNHAYNEANEAELSQQSQVLYQQSVRHL